MPIIGFSYSKIHVDRKSSPKGKISINNNVSLKDVKETELSLGKDKQKGLIFSFEFTTDYEPDMAKILLGGDVVYIEEEKKVKSVLEEWKKNKRIEKELMSSILNHVLQRCNIQALILSRDLNLPSPIPLPRVGQKAQQQK